MPHDLPLVSLDPLAVPPSNLAHESRFPAGAQEDGAEAPEETTSWSESHIKRFLRRHPRMGNLVAIVGIASPLLGQVAQGVSHVQKLRLTMYEQFGETAFYVLHIAIVTLLILLLLGGFAILGLLLDRRLRKRQASIQRRRLLASLLGVTGLCAASASVWAWAPATPNTQASLMAVSDRWRTDLFSTQGADGGFRYARNDLEAESQALSTAQGLTAILSRAKPLAPAEVAATRAAFDFLHSIELQEKNEGWGYFSYVPWGVTEINAWVALALARSIKHPSATAIWGTQLPEARQRLQHCSELILSRLMASGGWSPVNDTHQPRFVRTYSTTMSLWALLEIQRLQPSDTLKRPIQDGLVWLLSNADLESGGWRPSPFQKHKLEGYPGLTAQVIFVLLQAAPEFKSLLVDGGFNDVLSAFDTWLAGEEIPPRRLNFSTRAVSDNDRAHDADRYLYRSPRMIEGSTHLWFAWTLLACKEREHTAEQFPELRTFPGCGRLAVRINEAIQFVSNETTSYVAAENLMALDALAGQQPH